MEIKIAPGMVADLYTMPELQKKELPKQEQNNKSAFSGFFSKKK